MPASAVLIAPVVTIRVAAPEPAGRSRAGRECPVCAEHHRPTPECSAEFAVRNWIACPDCDGTGWDTTGQDIWCATCGGAKLLEG